LIGNQIGADKPGEQSGDKKYDPNGWRFFSPAGGSEVNTKRRLFAGCRTRIIFAVAKGKDVGQIDQGLALPLSRVRDCSVNPSPEDCSGKPGPEGNARKPFLYTFIHH